MFLNNMEKEFKFLFTPIKLGSTVVRNRVFVAAHSTGFSEPVDYNRGIFLPSKIHAYYYAERAKGGVGLIIMEAGIVHYSSEGLVAPHLYDERSIPRLKFIAESVHKYNSKIFGQLYHGGNQATNTRSDLIPLSSSAVPSSKYSYVIPAEMTVDEIHEIVEGFVKSAKHLKQAGLDGAELHGTHGYLIEQFLSLHYNKRSDSYGGSLENRMRFLLEIIDGIRTEVGYDFTLGLRLNADELLDDGLKIEETKQIATKLDQSKKLDFLNVDIGITGRQHHIQIAPLYVSPGHEVEYIAQIKSMVRTIPVLGTPGRCSDPYFADWLIAESKMDMVGMTRAHIADPYIINKTLEGRIEDIRPCIGTNEQCYNRIGNGLPLRCNVNPSVGFEEERPYEIPLANKRKKVLIIGCGPAGLEATRVCALRGHKVIAIEKNKSIGGQLIHASKLPGRADIGSLIRWYEIQLEKLKVILLLNSEVTCDLIDDLIETTQAETVIISTGAVYDKTGYTEFTGKGIQGINNIHVFSPEEAIYLTHISGKKAIIFDDEGFEVAPSLAVQLAKNGAKVVLVTRHSSVGQAIFSTLQLPFIYRELSKFKIEIYTNSIIERIERDFVIIKNIYSEDYLEIKNVDFFVPVTYKRSINELYKRFKEKVKQTYVIGDARAPRRLRNAIVEGYSISLSI